MFCIVIQGKQKKIKLAGGKGREREEKGGGGRREKGWGSRPVTWSPKSKRMRCMENTLVLPVRQRKISTHCMHACTLVSEHKPQTSLSASFLLSCSKVCPTPSPSNTLPSFFYMLRCSYASCPPMASLTREKKKNEGVGLMDQLINKHLPFSKCQQIQAFFTHFFRRCPVQ